jgi:hypothetical protein
MKAVLLSLLLLLTTHCLKANATSLKQPDLLAHTQSVTELCRPYATRSELVDSYDLDVAKGLMHSVNSTVGIDGLTFFKMLANNQTK